MKLVLVVIVIFAAIHCGHASEAACELADFDHKGMEKFWEMECESYMEDGQFNVPVSTKCSQTQGPLYYKLTKKPFHDI